MPHHFTPEECLALAIEAVGKFKDVGEKVRPDLDPVAAGKWLAHCIDTKHAQRLNYTQERLVYRLACASGEHAGFRAYAESIGYRVEPIDQQGELLTMARKAASMAERANDLSLEVHARMQAAGLKVEP